LGETAITEEVLKGMPSLKWVDITSCIEDMNPGYMKSEVTLINDGRNTQDKTQHLQVREKYFFVVQRIETQTRCWG